MVADAGVHGVESEDGLAAVGAVEMKRLNDEDLPAVVGGRFLGGDDVADDAADQYGGKFTGDSLQLTVMGEKPKVER